MYKNRFVRQSHLNASRYGAPHVQCGVHDMRVPRQSTIVKILHGQCDESTRALGVVTLNVGNTIPTRENKECIEMIKEHCVRMKKASFLLCMLILLTMFLTGSAMAGGMRWPIGISYVNGFEDLTDQYEDNIKADGNWVLKDDISPWPVGISFQPYYQWDDGLRVGVGVGPIMMIMGDVDHFQLPFSVTAGYTFMPDGPVSPYVKVGPSYHFASGDDYEGSNVGFVAGVGIELLKNKSNTFALGLEAVYDSAEVEIEDRTTGKVGDTVDIKAAEFVVSLLLRF